MTTPVSVRVTAATHPGRVRPGNEDCIRVGAWQSSAAVQTHAFAPARLGPRPLLCAVADGLGGHAGGEVASHHAVHTLADRRADLTTSAAITRALRAVNVELCRRMRVEPALDGMGTTVAGLVVGPQHVRWFNVGDSRIYRVSAAGALEQLSVDDRLPADLSELYGVPGNALTAALGGGPHPQRLNPHVGSDVVTVPSRWLLCTDGLTDEVDEAAIRDCLEEDDGHAVRALVSAALWAGGADNISVVVVSLEPATPHHR